MYISDVMTTYPLKCNKQFMLYSWLYEHYSSLEGIGMRRSEKKMFLVRYSFSVYTPLYQS